jgi:serine/threonine protein kinase
MSAKETPRPGQAQARPATGPSALSQPAFDDPRIVQALEEYLEALEAGNKPHRQRFLARHPEIAKALAECLDGMEALHPAPAASQPAAGSELQAHSPLGDFRIVREIGRGGMGVVYEAVQLSLGRRVALKVLPFAGALDAKQLQRFKNEAAAAAHLHHTNIVPVYAVGNDRGVHFYAMQLIEGQDLATLIEDMRCRDGLGTSAAGSPSAAESSGSPSSPGRPDAETQSLLGAELSTQRSEHSKEFFRTAARLLVQAAQALDYAHKLDVVHRDIKPANLLVDNRGTVWITDFGLAQFHTENGLTQSGDLLGTVRYMSPEQAGGQRALIDHRTDIYSLGATLYELLTLQPIFDGADRRSLLQQIMNEEPRPPRSIDRSIPPELETIVLKAVRKAPAERYATAHELADDLQRFLEDRPIQARRPSLLDKATKWTRRHKGVVASAVAALVLSVLGLATATVLTARAYDRERQKAMEATIQRARAEENFLQARRAVDQFAQISEEELAGNPFLEGPRRRLLEAALVYYQDFLDQRRDDPSTRKELEASREKVKTILGELTVLMGASHFALLQQESVQDDIALSESQRQVVARLDQKWHEAFREFSRVGSDEREHRRLVLAREQEAEVERLLTPLQLARFKQIVVQNQGPAAFRDPEIVAALNLSAGQRERIRAIQADAFFDGPDPLYPPGGGPRRGPRGPREPPRRSHESSQRAAMEQIEALLTTEQRKRWKELIGKPMEGPLWPPPPNSFRPPPH